jgi:hypothetical protein
MSAVRRIGSIFGRVRSPLGRISTGNSPKDEDLIHAVIQRIEVEGEDHVNPTAPRDSEQIYRRLMRRIDWQLKNSGITTEELVRSYNKEVKALLLFKSYERNKKKRESTVIRDRLEALGFEFIQTGVWVLPPSRTPPGLDSQDAIKLWFRQQMVKGVGKNIVYVFPFVASVDLKHVVAERRGIRKMPMARTLFGVLSLEEVVPPSHLYRAMESKGRSVREIILSGDVSFLSSAFAPKEELEKIQANELEVGRRLRHATGAANINLEDLANLGPETVAKAIDGFVPHTTDFAQRMIVEAQYWMRVLGGSVPG